MHPRRALFRTRPPTLSRGSAAAGETLLLPLLFRPTRAYWLRCLRLLFWAPGALGHCLTDNVPPGGHNGNFETPAWAWPRVCGFKATPSPPALPSFPISSHRIASLPSSCLLPTSEAIFSSFFLIIKIFFWEEVVGLVVVVGGGIGMETAAAAMLEAGVGRFSRAPALATALLAEMWAPLAVALAALATLPSLLRRLQVIVLRLRSRGKEVIQSHIGTYYSSCDEDDEDDGSDDEDESSDDDADASSSEEEGQDLKRIGFYEGATDGGVFPWGGAVVRTWQGRFSGRAASGLGGGVGGATATGTGAAFPAAVRLWAASTASGEPWWASCSADEGGCRDGAAAEADQVVVGWRREHASQQRRRRRAVPLAHTGK